MSQLFIKEYLGLKRTAQVYLDQVTKDYIVKMYQGSQEDLERRATESQALVFAESWAKDL